MKNKPDPRGEADQRAYEEWRDSPASDFSAGGGIWHAALAWERARATPPTPAGAEGVHRIVCAAMLMDDGLIVPGVRHFSPDMRGVLQGIYGTGYHLRVCEQGFIDTHGNFLDRERAWWRAVATKQIREQVSVPGTLYSENLY